jgi:16S rRNA (adenine1518-N6/adenine1519-N6)-dimethyltransferase
MSTPTQQHVQTRKEIEAALAAAGVRPLKRFGQNFLIDGNLMRRLAESAELNPADAVLEVGPGTGGLTDLLAAAGCRVCCAEIDRTFAGLVADRFVDNPQVSVIQGDVLGGKHRLSEAVAAALAVPPGPGGAWKLVANLPYQAATPLVLNLIVDYPQVRRMCFTVQAEVADRFIARPGTREYGPLSILTQTMCRVSVVAQLGPQLFWPRPKVDSTMLRLDVVDPPAMLAGPGRVRAFAEFVRHSFDHRRKQLRSALGYVIDSAARDRIAAAFDTSGRPEDYDAAAWLAMFPYTFDSPPSGDA